MKRFCSVLLLFWVCALCGAQSIDKRYSSYLSNVGTINFFRPQKLKHNTNVHNFVFDMTYISYNDSVTVNCSLRIQSASPIKSLSLRNNKDEIKGDDVSVLYRDVQKHYYEIRVTSRFSFNDIKAMFRNSSPLFFDITLDDGLSCTASYRRGAWKRESRNVTRIFESINY